MNARALPCLMIVSLVAAGCDRSGADMAAAGARGSTAPVRVDSGLKTIPPGRPLDRPFLPPIGGKYAATSTTAMSLTGDLELTANALTFAFDLKYGTRTTGHTRASTPWARDGSNYATLFGVQTDADIELRAVFFETVGKSARNGGVCGAERPTYVALTPLGVSPNGSDVAMAFFKGMQPPGKEAMPAALCGTFRYAPVGSR